MLTPDEREIYSCRTCHDFGIVWNGNREVKCFNCSTWSPERRAQEMRAETAKRAYAPGITPLDMSDEELAEFKRLRAEHPNANKLTAMAWIEGRRYNPADDPEFMALCERRLSEWRRRRGSEGIV